MKTRVMALLLACAMLLSACAGTAQSAPEPTPEGTHVKADAVKWPKEKLTQSESGEPQLRVYVVEDKKTEAMDIETYVQGVLAGEMKNDWPIEALKAQAILARTFVLKFIQDKDSKYPDADISTDIEEAQAYSAADINERIQQAVAETRGLMLSSEGELPYAWFHAHSGGATELAKVGLGWDDPEPAYTQCTQGNEPETADGETDVQTLRDAQKWTAEFPVEALEAAFAQLGHDITLKENSELTIGERGDSVNRDVGRADGYAVLPFGRSELHAICGDANKRTTSRRRDGEHERVTRGNWSVGTKQVSVLVGKSCVRTCGDDIDLLIEGYRRRAVAVVGCCGLVAARRPVIQSAAGRIRDCRIA